MRVGIIAPVNMLDRYCTTKIQYCLPSLLVGNEEYRRFYKSRKKQKNIIIMDSRKVGSWKREPEDFGVIERALGVLEPSYLVLPSWMFNKERTTNTIKEFLHIVPPSLSSKLVAPLEGTNEKEVNQIKNSLEEVGIKTFALPEHIQSFCRTVDCGDRPIVYIENHLRVEELEGLNGILVTSLPIRLGLQGRLLSDYLPGPPSLTFHESEDKFPKVIERNIKELLEYYEV